MKLYHNFSLIIFIAGIFFFSSCTIQVAPQDSSSKKNPEIKSFNFEYSSKKSKKKKEAKVTPTQEVASQQPVTVSPKPEGDIWACFFDCGNFGAQWGQAKILTMASDATNGEYEVEFKYNTHATAPGLKKWTKYVILKWHRATNINELKPGMVVLSGGDGTSYLAVVKEVFAYKSTVVVERFFNPGSKIWTETWDAERLGAVKIIEEPVMKDPRVK